ncbi:FecR protein [Variovorax sp. PBL-H6]|uniref:FecR domain-containing protein n=1 Tax=Variovorax sp. PBL-H6 TaxID=434009 RepID=UPI0013186766|nr:FecR domain-containing protein [Variovorax sp. PBL-H6]VTU37897.1 FecR protein [Variovorax sp. PBL-H6]
MTKPAPSVSSRRWLFVTLVCLAALPTPRAHAQPAKVAPGSVSTYLVQPGDTLWGLARRYMESAHRWPELQRGNAVPVPERLRVGQMLNLEGPAAVLHVSGNVSLQRGAEPEQQLAAGTALVAGDRLTTGRDSFLTVGFADGSRVVLPSSSSARLTEAHGRRTQLELLSGRVESYVEKQREREFEIRTRSFALGVKGTHFRVRSEGGVQALEVLEGTVQATELGSGNRSTEVAALEGLPLGAAGSVLEVRSLLPAPTQHVPSERNTVAAEPVTGAAAYRLQLASDASFLRLAAESREPAPRFALQDSLAAGFYHTRVSALDEQGIEGQASEGVTFVAPAQGPMTSEARAADNSLWQIRWTTRQRQRHTFELARTPDFASPLVVESGTYMSGVTVGPLEGPARYYWRCREQAEGESSPPTEWGGSFEVTSP